MSDYESPRLLQRPPFEFFLCTCPEAFRTSLEPSGYQHPHTQICAPCCVCLFCLEVAWAPMDSHNWVTVVGQTSIQTQNFPLSLLCGSGVTSPNQVLCPKPRGVHERITILLIIETETPRGNDTRFSHKEQLVSSPHRTRNSTCRPRCELSWLQGWGKFKSMRTRCLAMSWAQMHNSQLPETLKPPSQISVCLLNINHDCKLK